jgi:hypothetical protein
LNDSLNSSDIQDEVDLGIGVSPGFKAALSQLSLETGDSEADLLVKSIALLIIALRAKKQGKRVVIAGDSTTKEITGF